MSSSPVLLFVIVGKNEPLYEAEIDTSSSSSMAPSNSSGGAGGGGGGAGSPSQQQQQNELSTRQNYFVLHSALDLVEKSVYSTSNMYLRVVDKVNQQQVSTFVTAANVKFMLLHGGKGEEVIKNFFGEVYGYYVKLSMNPFYKYDTPIMSKAFDARVRAAARAYLS
ncbi:hypothetical protein ACHAWU_009000 [Discostella pseudostelligera]|uniref:Trafficking protein particle complex subunit n=1 Tax=Discostella pseudostelligera TaxID=259834 RepID=A0ABD3MM73_9STRA